MEKNNLPLNAQVDNLLAQEAIEEAQAKLAKREAIKHGLKKFGAQIAITVGAGLASHFILKALLPAEEEPTDEELNEMIETIVIEPDED